MSIGNRPQPRGDEVEFWLAQARVSRQRSRTRTRQLDPVVPPAVLSLVALAAAWLLSGGI